MALGPTLLLVAGSISVAAALLHLACIAGGPSWYRAMGAGEQMAQAATRGELRPTVVTLLIAAMLGVWAGYAFSGAGVIDPLPLLRPALAAVSVVLLLRGLAVPLMRLWRPDLSNAFLYRSSAIVLFYGLVFAGGTWLSWPALTSKDVL